MTNKINMQAPRISKAAAIRHGKSQVGVVHQMRGGSAGYGYLSWDAWREVWMQPYTTSSHKQATQSRAKTIRTHAIAAQISGTLDTTDSDYREAMNAADMCLAD